MTAGATYPRAVSRTLSALALHLLVVVLLGLALAPAASAGTPIEDLAGYHPQRHCHPEAKPGTTFLGHRLVRRFGGGFGPIARPCRVGGTSEHKEGRAFDWLLDASVKADKERAQEFLDWVLATDRHGNPDARARRMGIMYVIWNDHMYPAWTGFRREPYLSASCPSRKECSTTLRHRDHLHISLSRRGGKGLTSWFVRRSVVD